MSVIPSFDMRHGYAAATFYSMIKLSLQKKAFVQLIGFGFVILNCIY